MKTDGPVEPTEEDRRTAADLLAKGYQQTSSKYRHVARLPEGETAVEALCRHNRMEVEKIRQEIEVRAAAVYRRMGYAEKDGNQRTLTPEEFKAFKAAGGSSSW